MHPAKIQEKLKRKKVTQAKIAGDLGVKPQSVSDVINKSTVSDRIMKAISEAIGEDYRMVFPEYYLKKPARKTSKSAVI